MYFDDAYLVTRSYRDDGVFFLIYLATVVLFIIKDKIGKWAVTVWTAMWFLTQFASHELVTLTGNGYENMSSYFEGALRTKSWIEICHLTRSEKQSMIYSEPISRIAGPLHASPKSIQYHLLFNSMIFLGCRSPCSSAVSG